MTRALLLAVTLSACSHAPISRSLAPLYVDEEATHLELLGADGEAVWARALEVIAANGLTGERERRTQAGRTLDLFFSIDVPGTVSTDYEPARIVAGDADDIVTLRYAITLHMIAHPTGLVRLWFTGESSFDDRAVDEVAATWVVPHRLLEAVARQFSVVKYWRTATD